MSDRVRVPTFDELPLLELPAVRPLYRSNRHTSAASRLCSRDGIPIGQHAACASCGALAGNAHPIAHYLVDGRCPGCRAA